MTTKIFSTILTGDQEVPPSGSTAIGLGVVLWDEAADTATYGILVKGVDFGAPAPGRDAQTAFEGDDVVAMHVHNQARGQNGPVVFGQIGPPQDDDLRIALNADGSWTVRGAWEPTDPASTSIETFAAQLDAAEPGTEVPLYFNVHTGDLPGGAIRGQWVALGTVDRDADGGGSGASLRLSLDADTAEALFEGFLRFLARDALSDRDPSREPGDGDALAAFADLVALDLHPNDHAGHGTDAVV